MTGEKEPRLAKRPGIKLELREGVVVRQVCVPNAGLHVSPHLGCPVDHVAVMAVR